MYYYDLRPKSVEQLGKITRIETDHGVFALKETDIDACALMNLFMQFVS